MTEQPGKMHIDAGLPCCATCRFWKQGERNTVGQCPERVTPDRVNYFGDDRTVYAQICSGWTPWPKS